MHAVYEKQRRTTPHPGTRRPGPPAPARILVAVLLAGITGLLLLKPLPWPPFGRLGQAFFDLLHVPLFFALTFLLHRTLTGRFIGPPARFAQFAVPVLALVGLFELLQHWAPGRTPAWYDACMGAAGVVLAGLANAMQQPAPFRHRCRIAILWLAITMAALWRPWLIMEDALQAEHAYPLLASFETERELTRWHLRGCRLLRTGQHATHGSWAGRVEFTDPETRWPGLTLTALHSDWRRGSTLEADIYWPGKTTRLLHVRIDDRLSQPPYSDRFQTVFELRPRTNRLAIPLEQLVTPSGRPLDLKRIKRVVIFLDEAPSNEVFFIDHLHMVMEQQNEEAVHCDSGL